MTPRPPDPVLVVIAAYDGLIMCPNGLYPVDGEFRCGAVRLRYDPGGDEIIITHPSAACELALHPDGEAAADFAEDVRHELIAAIPFGDYVCHGQLVTVNELAAA